MALLLLQLPSLNPNPFLEIITAAIQKIPCASTLVIAIKLSAEVATTLSTPAARVKHFQAIQEVISAFYVHTAKINEQISVTIIFTNWCGYGIEDLGMTEDLKFQNEIKLVCVPADSAELLAQFILDFEKQHDMEMPYVTNLIQRPVHSTQDLESTWVEGEPKNYAVVAVGGTFDHLHAGHKILLSMTAWIATDKVICGVSDDSLLLNKKFKEYLEPISVRLQSCTSFLKFVAHKLEYYCVSISDVYGPTAYDPTIEALVISEETQAGSLAINKLRKEKGLEELDILSIDVIGTSGEMNLKGLEGMEAKLSSTLIRERLASKGT